MLLGCIADDLTGATDLSLMLSRGGLRTIQTTGVPTAPISLVNVDAVVVALKSRTIPAGQAVVQSLAAARWLLDNGAQKFLFKYCSTFDSTDLGNIGPVAEALLNFLGETFTIACPAFPAAGRSIYQGNLFVNGLPLAESSMREHPLTPMRDSNLCRVLQRQIVGKVGLVSYTEVDEGIEAIENAFDANKSAGMRFAVVDALNNSHLLSIGKVAAKLKLVTGGSGIAIGLPAAYLELGLIDQLTKSPTTIAAPAGRSIILAGSCSEATRGQVQVAIAAGFPALRIDPLDIASGTLDVAVVLNWLSEQLSDKIPLIYSSDDPLKVGLVQEKLGRDNAGHIIEALLAGVAKSLPRLGYSRIVVAGGETSGAVVEALGIKVLLIGPEIDPGVPWTLSVSIPPLALALKSGNFGSQNFFIKAWEILQ